MSAESPFSGSRASRRQFLARSAAGAAAVIAAPYVIADSKTDTQLIMGEGDHRFEVHHGWAKLPAQFTWQTTHNVALDKAGNLYVIHEGREDQPEHPSIFVFDPQGKYIRSFGAEFQGGGHGIEVREEDGQEYLYVCAYQQVKSFAKLSLTGETVWRKHAPMQSGVYAAEEDTKPQRVWGQDRFMPTNFAFLPDGDFLLADGYGSFYIHRYSKDGEWKGHFGGPGEGNGKFNTPHGVWYDARPGRTPAVAVCDRAHHTLQYLTLDGEHIETLTGYGLPANLDTWNDLLLVPELFARVTLLNAKNEVVARLGDDVARVTAADAPKIREMPDLWTAGKFVHPHDACFSPAGDIYVAEWVQTGRITKLRRLS